MTDNATPIEAAPPPTDANAAPAATPPAPAAAPPTDTGAQPAAPTSDDWRADWTDKLKLDDKARTRLDRFSAPHEIFDSYLNLEKKLSDSRAVRVPDANSSPEEIAAWNKARGVPETPDGYKIEVKPPEGLEIAETDQAMLKALTTEAHKRGFEPSVVNFAYEFVYKQMEEAAAQQVATAEQAAAKAEAALRREWGREYGANVKWAEAAAAQFGAGHLLNTRLADGSLLGDNPDFVKAMAKIGRLNAEDPFMLEAVGQGVGKSPEDRKAELMELRRTNPQRYASAEVQAELEKINTALARRQDLAAAR